PRCRDDAVLRRAIMIHDFERQSARWPALELVSAGQQNFKRGFLGPTLIERLLGQRRWQETEVDLLLGQPADELRSRQPRLFIRNEDRGARSEAGPNLPNGRIERRTGQLGGAITRLNSIDPL